jgi:hypothetical protein
VSVARQWLDKEVSTATDTHNTIREMLEAAFSMLFVPRLYSEGHGEKLAIRRYELQSVVVDSQ